MNKAAIICKLHEITDHYLLGAGTWPADREFLPTFFKTVRELGLDEDVPDSRGSTRSTALGKELNLDLLMAFVGAWVSGRFLTFLKENEYLEESEAEALCAGPLKWKLNESSAGTYFEHILTFVAPIFQIEGMVACQYLVRKPNPWDFSTSGVATGRAVGDASGRRA